jgi:xylulokinase
MKADITGKDIEVPESDLATPLGAALLAGVGVGVYASFADAVASTVTIKREQKHTINGKDAYDAGYRIYRELYEQLKGLMRQSRRQGA